MRERLLRLILGLLSFLITICVTVIPSHAEILYASENDNFVLIKKISKSYTKKFCNAVGFGLSKESAMNFSIKENKEVFKKRKEINNINKELLAEEIASSVVEKCGYPINLFGEKGVRDFKNYYLSKDNES